MKILLLSDTHSCIEKDIMKHVQVADEVWHAGDWGNKTLSDMISAIKPVRSVYGNVDGEDIRMLYPLNNRFNCEGLSILMTHIGGYPGHYSKPAREEIKAERPDIFICGHSHILRVMKDPALNNMITINPGAAGRHGFHNMRTMIRMEILKHKITLMEVIELGTRTSGISPEIK
ncbi:MAG: metallophosphoesterase family protein [Bacteroidia bacterium]|nr:metallophosphoesterase family protein [Bacteroidia bacterium]